MRNGGIEMGDTERPTRMRAIARRDVDGTYKHTVQVREHQLTVDEPLEKGGDDIGLHGRHARSSYHTFQRLAPRSAMCRRPAFMPRIGDLACEPAGRELIGGQDSRDLLGRWGRPRVDCPLGPVSCLILPG